MIHTQLLRVLLTGTVLLATAVVASGCRGSRGEAAEGSVEAADDQGLQLSSCQLSMPGQALRVPAECGTLNVPEDRQHPEGRQLSLTVAVLRAVRRDPQPDPLFLLAGGPGQAATEAFLPLLGALRGIRQDRDLVLVDQRGTGSSHPLDCDMGQEGELDALDEEEQGERLQECLKTWDADPRFYHTAVAMEDLDAVRQALGYQRINLYGVSYGTRSALTYLRMFPERVRTILLDGVVPPDLVLGVEWGRDAQRALSLIFDRCRQDEACAEAF
ncbi:MAG: alpha/beta fold hydrolase, partial [Acidobacteria bacterium]|nr:alpha/beta fold hydrolase [Acidobacteriota bacterium]